MYIILVSKGDNLLSNITFHSYNGVFNHKLELYPKYNKLKIKNNLNKYISVSECFQSFIEYLEKYKEFPIFTRSHDIKAITSFFARFHYSFQHKFNPDIYNLKLIKDLYPVIYKDKNRFEMQKILFNRNIPTNTLRSGVETCNLFNEIIDQIICNTVKNDDLDHYKVISNLFGSKEITIIAEDMGEMFEGQTSLDLAIEKQSNNIAKYILDTIDINRQTEFSFTSPLHLAVFCRNIEITEFLLNKANINKTPIDSQGDTPLSFCKQENYKGNYNEFIEILSK